MRTVNATACARSSNRPNRPISARLGVNQAETGCERSPASPVAAFREPGSPAALLTAERFAPFCRTSPKGPGQFFATGASPSKVAHHSTKARSPSVAANPPEASDRTWNRLKFPGKPPLRCRELLNHHLGRARIGPDPDTSGEDSRDDSRAGQRAGAADGARFDQGDDHPDVREGRHRGIEAPAGADRLLGAVVRPLPPAHADH